MGTIICIFPQSQFSEKVPISQILELAESAVYCMFDSMALVICISMNMT